MKPLGMTNKILTQLPKYLTNTRDVTDKHVTEGWRWMSGISFKVEGRFLLEDAGNGLENQQRMTSPAKHATYK